ncbi:MAG: hypothetical protein L7S42_05015 [Flavobacteriaceae bacterium]|nr:hypothetical protein [Flavobacteriaceae bacterium]
MNREAPSKLPDSENETDLCNTFVDFFADKVRKIEDSLKLLQSNSNFTTYNDAPICGVLKNLNSFNPVTEEHVGKIIQASASKSCVLDPIPTYLLKECLDTLLPVITRIINLSIKSSTVPACFKTAAVTPLLKKTTLDLNCLKNFRPISNLPFISKVLEKVILKKLNEHKSVNNLPEKFQSAYRKDHSTETALLRIQNDFLQFMDNKQCCFLVLLDLSAAFDTVNHSVLINRLADRFGIQDNALNWIQSYLSDRKNFVYINKAKSIPVLQQCNVPQGSVLGPTFFSDYILLR